MTTSMVLFDVFGVLVKPQVDEVFAALASFFKLPEDRVSKAYWANRSDYDRGIISDFEYWNRVSNSLDVHPPSPEETDYLIALDRESWSASDSRLLPIFDGLTGAGLELAILSNAPHYQADLIREAAWTSGFQHLFFSCKLGLIKPEPQIYEKVATELKVDPGEILFVDDNPKNTAPARQLGFQTIDFTDPESLRLELIRNGLMEPVRFPKDKTLSTISRERSKSHLYYSSGPFRIKRAQGVWVWDADDNRYLDCSAGTFNLSLGYQHPEIVRVIQEQADDLIHATSSLRADVVDRFVGTIGSIAPWNDTLVHPKVSSGSVANEGAIKIAQRVTGRTEIVSLYRAHLGQTLAMTALSGNSFRRRPLQSLPYMGFQIIEPYCSGCNRQHPEDQCINRSIRQLEDQLEFGSRGDLAAVIVEPISGNGGNVVYPNEFFAQLRRVVDEHGAKLIFDEIQTGIGRTGAMLAADHLDAKPDIITLAKGLGGSGAQVATILARRDCSGLPGDGHSFTYGANLLALAVGHRTVEIVSDPSFLAHVRLAGVYIMNRLCSMGNDFSDYISDVRGKGLMIGIEFNAGDMAKTVSLVNSLAAAAPKYGLLMRTSRYGRGNVLKIRPALNISISEAQYLCDQLHLMFSKELT